MPWYIFMIILFMAVRLANLNRPLTECQIFQEVVNVILWTVCFVLFENIFLYSLSGILVTIATQTILVPKLYPTPDTRCFHRRK